MPEYSLHELEAFRLRREMAELDRHLSDYQRKLDAEIAASVKRTYRQRTLCQKAGKAGYQTRMKNPEYAKNFRKPRTRKED